VHHTAPPAGQAAAVRLVVRAGADSQVNVVEILDGDGDGGLVMPGTHIHVDQAARVGYVGTQDLGPATWSLGLLDIAVQAQASVVAGMAGFGGDYARLRTDCRLLGRGATGNLYAAYFGSGEQTLDYRTFQEHIA